MELMLDLETICDELAELNLVQAKELQREIHEGAYHDGPGAVVQILGLKP